MSADRAQGYAYADLHVGIAFRSPGRTITDADILQPIFIGDTIFNYRIAELRDSRSRPTQAIATFDVEVVNQNARVVQRGRKALLVSKVPLDAVAASRTPFSEVDR